MPIRLLPSQSYLEECFTYDPETGLLYWKERPLKHFYTCKYPERERNRFNGRYAHKEAINSVNRFGYKVSTFDGKCVRAHKIIYKLLTGLDVETIDHIDGNKINNRPENLRAVTQSENQKNQKQYLTNKSGVTGVYWYEKVGKWVASINKDSKKIYLGCFSIFEEAVAIRKQAEVKYGYHINHGRQDEQPAK